MRYILIAFDKVTRYFNQGSLAWNIQKKPDSFTAKGRWSPRAKGMNDGIRR